MVTCNDASRTPRLLYYGYLMGEDADSLICLNPSCGEVVDAHSLWSFWICKSVSTFHLMLSYCLHTLLLILKLISPLLSSQVLSAQWDLGTTSLGSRAIAVHSSAIKASLSLFLACISLRLATFTMYFVVCLELPIEPAPEWAVQDKASLYYGMEAVGTTLDVTYIMPFFRFLDIQINTLPD